MPLTGDSQVNKKAFRIAINSQKLARFYPLDREKTVKKVSELNSGAGPESLCRLCVARPFLTLAVFIVYSLPRRLTVRRRPAARAELRTAPVIDAEGPPIRRHLETFPDGPSEQWRQVCGRPGIV